MAVGVVELALLVVAEHLVGLGGLLELLFALGIVAVDVGMQLAGQLAIGLLDLRAGRRREGRRAPRSSRVSSSRVSSDRPVSEGHS